ncbi:MAG: hypothetical protein ABL959_22265 [Pyrinomonadaceae bacterium]
MDPSKMTTQEVMMYAALFNAAIGLVLGLVPLILGFIKGRSKYGVIGFFACLVGGAILGIILSLPAAIFFTWLVVRGGKANVTGAQEVDNGFEN